MHKGSIQLANGRAFDHLHHGVIYIHLLITLLVLLDFGANIYTKNLLISINILSVPTLLDNLYLRFTCKTPTQRILIFLIDEAIYS